MLEEVTNSVTIPYKPLNRKVHELQPLSPPQSDFSPTHNMQ